MVTSPAKPDQNDQKGESRFTFAVCAQGDGPEEEIRVRRLLKDLARRHGLRVEWPEPGGKPNLLASGKGLVAVDVREIPPAKQAEKVEADDGAQPAKQAVSGGRLPKPDEKLAKLSPVVSECARQTRGGVRGK